MRFLDLGGLWADQALVVLGAYPLLRVVLMAVSPLRRVPFSNAKKEPKGFAPAFGPRRLGSLRSGIDPGAAATVCCAAPTSAVSGCARRSLRSHARIDPSTQPSDVAGQARSRALELALIVEWLEAPYGLRSSVDSPLTPALSRGRGGRFVGFSETTYDSVFQVSVPFASTSVSPLSLRAVRRFGRARVRGF
ncbi:hypothetical protein SAMN05216496_4195 [Pseudomonas sp. Z003-0.4C(8344-21)]|nr:hypothetical protein SAMN05216496_4195 [Pseudomonas sp. Z003-0.4C(8344-21)]